MDIGTEIFKEKLLSFGFNEKIPFEFPLYNSQIYGDSGFKTDIQLADSGYGQGEMLINPVHLAALYTMFQNNGNILAPHLLLDNTPKEKYWKEKVILKESADLILQDLIQVVENPNGLDIQL